MKSKQLIKLYHGLDLEKQQQQKKDLLYHRQILALIDQYLVLKTRKKKPRNDQDALPYLSTLADEFDILIRSIEDFL
jgi:hypothetical protein